MHRQKNPKTKTVLTKKTRKLLDFVPFAILKAHLDRQMSPPIDDWDRFQRHLLHNHPSFGKPFAFTKPLTELSNSIYPNFSSGLSCGTL